MKKFNIDVRYYVKGTVSVEADSLQEAEEKVDQKLFEDGEDVISNIINRDFETTGKIK